MIMNQFINTIGFKPTDKRMKIGQNDEIMIIDPGYDDDVIYMTTADNLLPGKYELYVSKNRTHTRVISSLLVHNDYTNKAFNDHIENGMIGVDSGLAGYFINKPNFNDKEWKEFIDDYITNDAKEQIYECPWGVFTNTGYGDGLYEVWKIKDEDINKVIGLSLIFMDQDEYE